MEKGSGKDRGFEDVRGARVGMGGPYIGYIDKLTFF